jgi:hypothetical protein
VGGYPREGRVGVRGCVLAWDGMPHYFAGGLFDVFGRKVERGLVLIEVGMIAVDGGWHSSGVVLHKLCQ